MNTYISILVSFTFIVIFGCDREKTKIVSVTTMENRCPNGERSFGDASICLPKIEGYTECLVDTFVKLRADDEMKLLGNEIIGVYLGNELYAKFKSSPETVFWDEAIKVYVNPSQKNKDVPADFINTMEKKLRDESFTISWSEVIDKMNQEKVGFTMKNPALIETYQPSQKVLSIIYLADYNFLDDNGKLLWIANLCIIKNRLIYFAYYKKYNNDDVINYLKEKSDNFSKELLRLNR